MPVTEAEYARWGKRAPKVRNGRTAERVDGGIGFWNGRVASWLTVA